MARKFANLGVLQDDQYELIKPGTPEHDELSVGLNNVGAPIVRITDKSVVTPAFMAEVTETRAETTGRVIEYRGNINGQCRVILGTWNSEGEFQSGDIVTARSKGRRENGQWIVDKYYGPVSVQSLEALDLSQVLVGGETSEEFFFLAARKEWRVVGEYKLADVLVMSEEERKAVKLVREEILDKRRFEVELLQLDRKESRLSAEEEEELAEL